MDAMLGLGTASLFFLPMIIIGVVLALVLIALLLAGQIKRIGYREVPLDTDLSSEEILSRLEKELMIRGKFPVREQVGLLLDDMVMLRIQVIEGASGKSIAFWAEPKDWLVALGAVLLIIAFYIALILGLVAYLKYDDNIKVLRSALTAILPRDKWYYVAR